MIMLKLATEVVRTTLMHWAIVVFRRKKNVALILSIILLFYLMIKTDPPDPTEVTVKEINETVPVKVQKGLSDLESVYYYEDGSPRKRNKGQDKGDIPKEEPRKVERNIKEAAKPGVAKVGVDQVVPHVQEKNTQNVDPNAQIPNNGLNVKDLPNNVPKAVKNAPLIVASRDKVPEQAKTPKQCDITYLSINDSNVWHDIDLCTFPEVSKSRSIDRKINALDKIELPLLRNYRNPCWYERLPQVLDYNSHMHMFWWQVKASFDRISVTMERRRKSKHFWRLRCLPLVYIIGLTQSGSLDLYNVLLGHPFIVKAATQEPFYWDRHRWKYDSGLSNYLDLFDEAAEKIRRFAIPKSLGKDVVTYHPKVTLDGSVNYLYEFGGLKRLSKNEDKKNPVVLAPNLIKNLTPSKDLKIILTIRNPTDRIFASYCSFEDVDSSEKSAEEFHTLVSQQIINLNDCFKKYPLHHCLHDTGVIRSIKKVEVHVGVYYGYIKEWLNVFPQMVVIRWEDMKNDLSTVYKNVITEIGLYPETKTIPPSKAQETDVFVGFNMFKKTKTLLEEFYKPYNQKLAELLKDNKYKY